ncbi:hypothetical protein R1flu_002416 [Riccia fluitans]|uniref:Uncharacterized protein n=1 Tax=Riccia fluitans TaxID=41844 RepID=A0ABD1Y659_9MARC
MGASTFQILLILTLAVMAECTRTLQSTDMVISSFSSHSHPPPLSPVQYQQFYEARQPPRAPIAQEYVLHRGYPFGSPSPYKSSSSSSESASPSVVEMSQEQYWSFQQLRKNPAGPNPIGNDLPKGKRLVKNRCPPPYGG